MIVVPIRSSCRNSHLRSKIYVLPNETRRGGMERGGWKEETNKHRSLYEWESCVPRNPSIRTKRQKRHRARCALLSNGTRKGDARLRKTRVLTCNWKVVPWDAAEASRSSGEIPRTRCRPFCDRQRVTEGGVGSVVKAAVTAWTRRAARRPLENFVRWRRCRWRWGTTVGSSRHRFDAARDALLIPAWWASRTPPRAFDDFVGGIAAPPGNRRREKPAGRNRASASRRLRRFNISIRETGSSPNAQNRKYRHTPRDTHVIEIQRPVFLFLFSLRKERAKPPESPFDGLLPR